jgi:hypothetical protein
MMAALDGVQRAFGSGGGRGGPGRLQEPWTAVRNLGMAVLNTATPIKGMMARYAMGAYF